MILKLLNEEDLLLFGQEDDTPASDTSVDDDGKDYRIYEKLGAHPGEIDGVPGTRFAVWAPKAQHVSVVGDFNGWDARKDHMRKVGKTDVWEKFVPDCVEGNCYKFHVIPAEGKSVRKVDPYGVFFESADPCGVFFKSALEGDKGKNAAIALNPSEFEWSDGGWLADRKNADPLRERMSIYELHLGSWRGKNERGKYLNYEELAKPLVKYVSEMGFTHVEFLPVAEHPYYPSWGYQVTGFFAPTSRYGTPDNFRFLVNALHESGIGVIIDWVPGHFAKDEWALKRFDGEPLYESDKPDIGHPEWGTLEFNYESPEVRSFLIANALYWCEEFHVDGLRVDAVASMLYLDYARKEGEWERNGYMGERRRGRKLKGNENLDAVDFIQELNRVVRSKDPKVMKHPGVVTIAEESTDWPGVTSDGTPRNLALGFTFKWDMGWMNDTLAYFQRVPKDRQQKQHDKLTFAMLYFKNEHYLRPLSHDEVVHEKRSLLGKMPGDEHAQFANLRVLLGYQWCLPGKQLLFMGGEIGQPNEWHENVEFPWERLVPGRYHYGLKEWVKALNGLYREEPALWEADCDAHGFIWIDCQDGEASVISFVRQNADCSRQVLAVFNLASLPHQNYRIGLPRDDWWREALNSDAEMYGGGNSGNNGGVHAERIPWHNQPFSSEFELPPLTCLVFLRE